MNRLVLIGNGFDLAHGLKTSYADFINWYKAHRVEQLGEEHSNVSKDPLCTIQLKERQALSVYAMNYIREHQLDFSHEGFWDYILHNSYEFEVKFSPFFERINKSIETKGWVDIENEYYDLLKQYALDSVLKEEGKISSMKSLNKQLEYLKELLVQYLTEITEQDPKIIKGIKHDIYAPFEKEDMSVHADYHMFEEEPWEWEDRQDKGEELMAILAKYGYSVKECMEWVQAWIEDEHGSTKYPTAFLLPKNIMLLNFNYTHTAQIYKKTDDSFEEIHIHGDIDDKKHVIFGYGDEMHSDFEKLKEREDGECLRHVKSIRYLEASNYKKVLRFIESAPFQVVIMGHSCGNSDRTLLNTIFEHPNCVSIKPYYYVTDKEKGTDNYTELVQHISRNFNDMKLMRDRVVNKTQCQPLVHD